MAQIIGHSIYATFNRNTAVDFLSAYAAIIKYECMFGTARIVRRAGSVRRWSVRQSVCLSYQSTAAGAYGGLLLSAVLAGNIYRQWLAPGAQRQQRRSTALSSKCGQWYVRIRVDEAEQTHTPVLRPFVRDHPGEPVPERKNQYGFY